VLSARRAHNLSKMLAIPTPSSGSQYPFVQFRHSEFVDDEALEVAREDRDDAIAMNRWDALSNTRRWYSTAGSRMPDRLRPTARPGSQHRRRVAPGSHQPHAHTRGGDHPRSTVMTRRTSTPMVSLFILPRLCLSFGALPRASVQAKGKDEGDPTLTRPVKRSANSRSDPRRCREGCHPLPAVPSRLWREKS
jgi:hypothetical protein